MNKQFIRIVTKSSISLAVLALSSFFVFLFLWGLRPSPPNVQAAPPIPPPEGYPKLIFSTKTVTPVLTGPGGATLFYVVELRNTGAYTAAGTTVSDTIPANTTYNGDGSASSGPAPTFNNGVLEWSGDVGFDSTVLLSFSVDVSPTFTGTIRNTAVISQPMIAGPVAVQAETVITDQPIFSVEKSSEPAIPGANKPLTYTLVVVNRGQPASNLPLTVVDVLPLSTTLRSVGAGGVPGPGNDVITWTRSVTLGFGSTSAFTFSVDVDNVVSGTVINNEFYSVSSPESAIAMGDPYTVTVQDPILSLGKRVNPDPPGSNREMDYTLTLLNKGSLATGLVITDRVPAGVTYVSGGTESDGVVTWSLPSLDTGESADFTFTVYVGDVAGVGVVNGDYRACSAEGVCQSGAPLNSLVNGPIFEASVYLDPIAKKPGGGGGPVTPTLVVKNLGPGNAIDATAYLEFTRISVQASDLYADPAIGTSPPFPPGSDCGEHCVSYLWQGSLGTGEIVTFTTIDGQNSIGGEEGTLYTATVVVTDVLGAFTTAPVTGTASGKVTHLANLLPTKSAPAVIGRGQAMTYTISVWNSGLSTDEPPFPILTDTVPNSVTVTAISNGGVQQSINGQEVISWTLPGMGPGDTLVRAYSVQVDGDLVSGTRIVNADYRTTWYEIEAGSLLSNTGEAVTTTVLEVGLVDSFKTVTPTVAFPGTGIVLTHTVHVVNSSPISLTGVSVFDLLPWQHSTYQRDAIASAGQLISDIVSVSWTGNVGPFSSELITLTVVVDPDYVGPITNTAVITHPSLQIPAVKKSVAYITDLPVLRIHKTAEPDPVFSGEDLMYSIRVVNLGQQATGLFVTDLLPENTTYVAGSASDGGQLVGDELHWAFPVLKVGEVRELTFRVTVEGGTEVINASYMVSSAEGVSAVGEPVVTMVKFGERVYLPVIIR